MPQVNTPDIATTPNFTALEAWVGKLQAWCIEARREMTQQESDKDTALARAQDLVDAILDMDRGLRSMDEVIELARQSN